MSSIVRVFAKPHMFKAVVVSDVMEWGVEENVGILTR